jgi:hypothetical protein
MRDCPGVFLKGGLVDQYVWWIVGADVLLLAYLFLK